MKNYLTWQHCTKAAFRCLDIFMDRGMKYVRSISKEREMAVNSHQNLKSSGARKKRGLFTDKNLF